jgi:peptidoglycan hydrolase-like protein with peptidoglycan-binding domain
MAGDTGYHLGVVSERHEGAGPATISTGKGDHGGVSYGTYQLSTNTGTINEYLKASAYKDEFLDLTPNTPAFDEKWRKLANDDPDFGSDQTNFIKSTHYDVQVRRLKDSGVDLTNRGPAVQEALFSTSVQYRDLTKGIFEGGLKATFGEQYDLAKLSDKDIVIAIQDYKIEHNDTYFRSSSPKVRESILGRATTEKDELVALAEGRELPELRHGRIEHHSTPRGDDLLRVGSQGATVVELQSKLANLGYRLNADGSFGPATKAAVESFQRDHQLTPDGLVGPTTRRLLDEQVQSWGVQQASQVPTRLDDPAHPDLPLFQQAREHVYRLDQQLGRTADQMSDNIASALTVAARTNGLERIDQITLSDDGSRLWATQRPPGQLGAFFATHAAVLTSAVNTPMEQSGSQWPQAMQQFQLHQEQTQAKQQEQLQQQTVQQDRPATPAMTR